MNQDLDYWLDSQSPRLEQNGLNNISSPKHLPHHNWEDQLQLEQRKVLNESAEVFPSVKRKYEQRFTKIIQSSSSYSPFEDDEISINSQSYQLTSSQHQAMIKSQRQQLKKIEEQNRYLKQKIDDLSFRLKETQIQLNKIKYSGNNNIANFQSIKQACFKQISDLMSQSKGQAPETCEAFRRLKNMTDFDGKLKIDLLNYFMSELLQNIINDSTFYLIDSILAKKGLWIQSNDQKLRKVDEQFIELMHLKEQNKFKSFKKDLFESLQMPAKKYKHLWKTFYKSYINLLNQGFVLENFLRYATSKVMTYLPKQNFAKLELFFEKIKLRKDIRVLRQSWFKQIQYEEEQTETSDKINPNKKGKTNTI